MALGLIIATLPRDARADADSDRQIAAESLFQEAKALIDQGHFAEACPKLAESNRLSPGIGVLLNLGGCYEKVGRIASAWAALNEAADRAKASGDTNREKLARERAQGLAPRLPRLTIELERTEAGIEIERDGSVVPAALVGQAVPVDPGEHVVVARAPGHDERTIRVKLAEAEQTKVKIAALAPSTTHHHVHERPKPGVRPQVVIGITTLAFGVAAVAVGAGTGGAALSKMSQARSLCQNANAGTGCSSKALALQDDARPLSTVSTIGFVVGGAAIATGLTVWLTAPSAPKANTASLVVSPSSLMLEGTW